MIDGSRHTVDQIVASSLQKVIQSSWMIRSSVSLMNCWKIKISQPQASGLLESLQKQGFLVPYETSMIVIKLNIKHNIENKRVPSFFCKETNEANSVIWAPLLIFSELAVMWTKEVATDPQNENIWKIVLPHLLQLLLALTQHFHLQEQELTSCPSAGASKEKLGSNYFGAL